MSSSVQLRRVAIGFRKFKLNRQLHDNRNKIFLQQTMCDLENLPYIELEDCHFYFFFYNTVRAIALGNIQL